MLDINILAAWGEFIGGIAVVVSLIYLAGQIRQNSRLLRASTASAAAQIQFGKTALTVQDPEVARIYWDGIRDRDSLSEADKRRFDPLLGLLFQGSLQTYEFMREGVGLPLTSEYDERGTRWMFQQPGFQQWWREWRAFAPPEYRNHVDGLIREGEAAE